MALDPRVLQMLGQPKLPLLGQFPPLRIPPLVKSEPIPQLSSSQKSKPVARGAKRKALPAASTAQPAKRRKTASCLAGLNSMPFDDMG